MPVWQGKVAVGAGCEAQGGIPPLHTSQGSQRWSRHKPVQEGQGKQAKEGGTWMGVRGTQAVRAAEVSRGAMRRSECQLVSEKPAQVSCMSAVKCGMTWQPGKAASHHTRSLH